MQDSASRVSRTCARAHQTSTLRSQGHSHQVPSTNLSPHQLASVLAFPSVVAVVVLVVVAVAVAVVATTVIPLVAAMLSMAVAAVMVDPVLLVEVGLVAPWLLVATPFLTTRGAAGSHPHLGSHAAQSSCGSICGFSKAGPTLRPCLENSGASQWHCPSRMMPCASCSRSPYMRCFSHRVLPLLSTS